MEIINFFEKDSITTMVIIMIGVGVITIKTIIITKFEVLAKKSMGYLSLQELLHLDLLLLIWYKKLEGKSK